MEELKCSNPECDTIEPVFYTTQDIAIKPTVYTNITFKGYWPVGSAAIVIAYSEEEAAQLLMDELEDIGLDQEIYPEDMIELEIIPRLVCILEDGQY